MYIEITRSMFHDAFRNHDRLENFSYEGREALFDYFEQLEKDIGNKIQLDVIAICCDYYEEDIETVLKDREIDSLDDLAEETFIVWNNGTRIIYQAF